MNFPKSLTTKEVARLCRVSDATVKRWEDSGLIASERTSGGHRRFRIEEVARFQMEQGLGLKRSNGDDSALAAAQRRKNQCFVSDSEFLQALIEGSEEVAANAMINEILAEKSFAEIFDNLVSPAMNRIGELWFEGKITVAREHLAVRTVMCALAKIRNLVPPSKTNGLPAICCAIEGDLHELPVHFAHMIFENCGFDVLNFGSNMPVYSLCDEITLNSPKLICISSTILSDVDRLSRDFATFSEKICRLNATVILGGRAFKDSLIRKRFPAEYFAANFTELSELATLISSRAAK